MRQPPSRPTHCANRGTAISAGSSARHAELYAQEYGWTEPFEGLCAQIVADFVNNYDAKRERCWIAEMNGENVGCVMLVKDSDEVARIRLLLVDPKARGLGLGQRLTDECVRFARERGYKKVTLWTHSILTAARHFTRRPASPSPRANRAIAGARMWSPSIGIWSCSYAVAPFAFGRRRCSSSRGRISTKLHGR